ncbi:FAD-dependent monooxygenase [Leptolyngbya ohadii]|uniref:FAD-dependent monooxygenase n=1 Tax=Leptolyngbya ohadii TaxID=1962290 RepID=UPI000B59FFAA|nr:FAD-dependent monooxygenase [Leptolyngbya ohadii]
MSLTEEILSQIPGNPLEGLRRVDRLWDSYKSTAPLPISEVVTVSPDLGEAIAWDAVICGGTLGIMLGAALAQKGWKVALIERGRLRGRDQEWNISRRELHVLTEMGLLTNEELEEAIATEFNPVQIRFHAGVSLAVRDVLNVGVDPVYLLERLKQRFLEAGGHLLENTAFEGAIVHPNGVKVTVTAQNSSQDLEQSTLTARLLIDAMGHFSPIVRQIRGGKKPDAVCLVVGTCATGFPVNETGDLFASITPLQNQCQYFWEAFPARDGRTTYLFTYLDAHPDRPSLEQIFEDYLTLLPQYQSVDLAELQFKRALFGFFPCYRDSPLQSPWDRFLAIGDSSGAQSPLSFGGFGAMIRHLQRLTTGVDAALNGDQLDRSSLNLLQPYQPSLSVTWLFQKAMSVRSNQAIDPNQINGLLSAVFQEMQQLGDPVLKPFLQDVVQFPALLQTLMQVGIKHPAIVLKIIPQVGIPALLDWTGHFANLGLYHLLSSLPLKNLTSKEKDLKVPPTRSAGAEKIDGELGGRVGSQEEQGGRVGSESWQYRFDRWRDAWKFGSGRDY